MQPTGLRTAALYLRSSKDRHDVSLDAQRRELLALAQAKSLAIVEEFSDAVESGKDEHRPGFQALLKTLKSRDRAWTALLALDTSRIARNQYLAHALHFECEKRGVRIFYAKLPETNTVTDVVVRAIYQAFDQVHSMMSREKGLAGMAENVRQGFRAGGRAPLGYRLQRIPTGATRDGAPVTKSKLARDEASAPAIAAYLTARAGGLARGAAAAKAGLQLAASTLIGVEWNALTYAGHTVWGMSAETLAKDGDGGGSRKGVGKRRPRAEWVVQHETHPALITTPEAEAILGELERGRRARYRTKRYLLSGIMFAPAKDGQPARAWRGEGDGCYRLGKGKRISQAAVEAAVVAQIGRDLTAKPFAAALTREARRRAEKPADAPRKALRRQIAEATAAIAKLADLAAQCETPRPFLERIATAETARAKLVEQRAAIEAEAQSAELLAAVREEDVTEILAGLASHMASVDPEQLKDLIAGLIERIELDPVARTCRIHYQIAAERGKFVATPRGADEFPHRLPVVLRAVRSVKVA